ncbi:MAG: TolB family protein [Myxococcaceae bacterium]
MRNLLSIMLMAGVVGGCTVGPEQEGPKTPPTTPVENCKVTAVEKLPSTFENVVISPVTGLSYSSMQNPDPAEKCNTFLGRTDPNCIYQLYSLDSTMQATCLSCTQVPGGPDPRLHKVMLSMHPTGQWIFVGVEQPDHEHQWMPWDWQLGIIQSGGWINMWATTPAGDRWYRLTDLGPNKAGSGYIGPSISPDGATLVWTELQNTGWDALKYPGGVWKLWRADLVVNPLTGAPELNSRIDITPSGAHWLEPGNFAPDGTHMLLSTDIGLPDGQGVWGQDQWSIDVFTGELQNLTQTPTAWDEHGLYSADGKKVVFMSSYPFMNWPVNPNTYLNLRTEFMLINSDGSGLQQLTHFNESGYPEFQGGGNVVAAVAGFTAPDTLFGTVMGENFSKTNWRIQFNGPCGSQ